MEINKKHFPKIMQDNDEVFLAHLEGVISSVDELCSLEITKNINSYSFRIATSLPKYNNILLEEILKLNTLFGIKLDLSKSIKSSGTIVFKIILN
jgi:hypothetical protein